MNSPLPPASLNQSFTTLHALEAGHLTLPRHLFISGASPTDRTTVPSLSFLITHPSHGRLVFDLGIRNPISEYSTPIQAHIVSRQPVTTTPDVTLSLASLGITPDEIDTVVLSHVHWDHIGRPSAFPRAQFLVGAGSLALLEHGLPGGGSHSNFERGLLPRERTVELTVAGEAAGWKMIAGFWMQDLFDDGSVFVVDAPGHLMGHVNLLVRTREGWWYLGGDAAHDRGILTGENEIGTWTVEGGGCGCIHQDKEMAEETLGKIRGLLELCDVNVLLAHDVGWYMENRGKMVWPLAGSGKVKTGKMERVCTIL
ncbi:beta-lactamase-like protein [Tricharina praecox]|uniref:beta-lactamase-like protein n=1 Tax=Tricharina praecox TaxID=43433 RepID=UPI00221E7300|nr:beta-lactamase-like protein [Tricharina praecox]KAI5843186.1 beta-lactamase-like protein [Tricharina praecox]